MNFAWTPEQEAIREAILQVCKPFDAAYWLERDRNGGFPLDFHKAIADAAAAKVITDKALADANAALKVANDKAAEAAIKATADKAAAVATVDKTSDNAAAITAYLKAAAAISGVTGTDSMTDTQLLAAIKANPGKVNYGTAGIGDNAQLMTELLAKEVGGLKMQSIA